LLIIDEDEIATEAMALAPKVWENYTRNAQDVLQS